MSDRIEGDKLESCKQWDGDCISFGWHKEPLSGIPDWQRNPYNGKIVGSDCPWWQIPDFESGVGDIKAVWEMSRFDWVVTFSQRAALDNSHSLSLMNDWLRDWSEKNRPYFGVNWKCGQEASIRLMNLAVSALILEQVNDPEPALIALVRVHMMRIAPTIAYAVAQDNNHGTSEAAALFIGGSWLSLLGDKDGERWQRTGRKWLENRSKRLIENDGSFSQYSVNYHRVMLDTYSLVEVWRRHLSLFTFSTELYSRLARAGTWLFHFTQSETGDAPNLGANDGARLLPLVNSDYRDYRPSVQLAMALFAGCSAYSGDGPWSQLLRWLKVESPSDVSLPLESIQFDSGGYSILRKQSAVAVLNYPRFRFRPSQSDALHLDFWMSGINLLRDAGTYSYNAGDEYIRYFGGTESHNTVQFDGRDQMPRLSRFLFGNWLKADRVMPVHLNDDCAQCAAGYVDSHGVSHYRVVSLGSELLSVDDQISGFSDKAVLRWRLKPGNWLLDGLVATNGCHRLAVSTDLPISRIELVDGLESRYYMQKTTVPVLEVEVTKAGTISTEYKYK